MTEQSKLDRKDAETLAEDLEGWAEMLEAEAGDDGEHPWAEDMQRHARMLRDKLLARIE